MDTAALFFAAVAWLAWSNGANDNFKGVATLFGSGTTSYRRALSWAAVTTFLGGVTALLLGDALIRAFSGKGLVGPETLADSGFLLSVCVAAAATVLLATRLGFPISTTHAILGALVGAGLAAPGGVFFSVLGSKFVLPLLLTPLASLVITFVLYRLLRGARVALGVTEEMCICVGREVVEVLPAPVSAGALIVAQTDARLRLGVATEATCMRRLSGRVAGIHVQTLLDWLHFSSAGAVGFARGLQDTAKIVGLLVGASLVGLSVPRELFFGVGLVTVFMTLGGLLGARRVARRLSHEITDMNHGQGFTANVVTAGLVIGTALAGLGVSTTHCSVGALFGIGAATGTGRGRMIGQIVLAWLITLPVAALLALGLYWLIA